MCIIVIVPEGEQIPEKRVLENCFSNNSDGIGYMYQKGKNVIIRKGFLDFSDFYRSITAQKITGDLVIHFRYATHGTISPANCHPFPISGNLGAKKSITHIGIAHNGIIQSIPTSPKRSDTKTLIESLPLDVTIDSIEQHIGIDDGKFAIMTSEKTYMIGDFIFEKGVYYSNHTYSYQYISPTYNDDIEYNTDICKHCIYYPGVDMDIDETLCLDCDDYDFFDPRTNTDMGGYDDYIFL